MRKYIFGIIAFFYCFISVNIPSVYADNWMTRWQFGGAARYYAVGFNIASRGYIGMGYDGSTVYKDFWEYNPGTNFWTQKADFAGTARASAVGFSIGSKGYLATGRDTSSYVKDFWEYDPTANTWKQKADFAGAARALAVGFAIGSKGYVGTGGDDTKNMKDFWEYDPETDVWSQKADFAGTARYSAVGFSIGSVGYVGTGYDGTSSYNDFWEYNPSTNIWNQKTNFSGIARYGAVGFSIGGKGYIGTGYNGSSFYKDLWEYDPSTNIWKLKTEFSGSARYNAVGFTIDNLGYLGTGYNNSSLYADFWMYDPRDTLTFTDKTNVEPNQTIPSNTVTVSWISSPTAISITGGTYSINGGKYTSTAGTINTGDTVTVHLLSSENFGTITNAILTIGGVSDTFSVTTRGADTTPDQFTFIDQTLVQTNTVITSNTITVSGIEAAVNIAITGGTYSINGGTYTSDPGTVNNGDTVTVQVTSGSERITTVDAVVTIGGVSDTFSVKTRFVVSNVDSGPCFIATAAFGSPLAGQVEILRQFRDKYLLTNSSGRKFVAWYYRNGPVAANWIKDKPLAKAAVQTALYPLIGFSLLLISGYLPSVTILFLLSALLFLRFRLKKLNTF
jgi:hypothetical protein